MARTFIETYCVKKKVLPLPAYICDNNQKLWGTSVAGIPIVPPERLTDERVDDAVIVMAQVLPFTILDSLQTTYEGGGLQRYYHFMMPLSQLEAYLFYQENKGRIQDIYEKLADEKSKYAYRKYFQYLMEGNLTFPTIFTANAYWDNDLIGRLQDGEVIVYAGAYDGKHLDRALKSNPNVEVHGFEPNKNYAALLDEKYADLSNVHIYKVGLGDKVQKVCFDNEIGDSARSVSETERSKRVYETIEIEPLDRVLSGKVDLIALALGAEIKALHGAERIIRENKPVLAICVYHRIEHYVEVAETIHALCPEYRFYFRQHSIVPHMNRYCTQFKKGRIMSNGKLLAGYEAYVAPVFKFSKQVFTDGDESYVMDADGNRFLDLNGGQFCAVLGHGNPEVAGRAFTLSQNIVNAGVNFLCEEVVWSTYERQERYFMEQINGA